MGEQRPQAKKVLARSQAERHEYVFARSPSVPRPSCSEVEHCGLLAWPGPSVGHTCSLRLVGARQAGSGARSDGVLKFFQIESYDRLINKSRKRPNERQSDSLSRESSIEKSEGDCDADPSRGSSNWESSVSGALDGIRVVELAGIGPGPHTAMMLADMGADVVRVDRPQSQAQRERDAEDCILRGRAIVTADLKQADDRDRILKLIDHADVVLEGFRPGVTERLGLGPDVCMARNPSLVYTRITGWGQEGPWSQLAGHDINYISITGALHAIGTADAPINPVNFVGDYGGGSMFALSGTLAALVERQRSGRGQVVDAAIVDGTAILTQILWSQRRFGEWVDRRESNFLDGGAPYYRTYKCADDRFIAVGALEDKFYSLFLTGLGVDNESALDRSDHENWPALTALFADKIASRSRDHWCDVFGGTDACVTPVLRLDEVSEHTHIVGRNIVVEENAGKAHARAAPRFGRSQASPAEMPVSRSLDFVVDKWSSKKPS
nr:CaiB/BaiF CoA-transferase family protein [Rhodococcus sp. WY5]